MQALLLRARSFIYRLRPGRHEVFCTLGFLAGALVCLASCDVPADKRPVAATEYSMKLGKDFTGTVVRLPTGERVLLTKMEYVGGSGGTYYSVAAVLLPDHGTVETPATSNAPLKRQGLGPAASGNR